MPQNYGEELYRSTIQFLNARFPQGWGGVAGVRLEDGSILTSISPDFPNEASSVCMELGAILEAAKRNVAITHCICLVREDETAPIQILTPCGICQERLSMWGPEVQCAVTVPDDPTSLKYVALGKLQPYHWLRAYPDV